MLENCKACKRILFTVLRRTREHQHKLSLWFGRFIICSRLRQGHTKYFLIFFRQLAYQRNLPVAQNLQHIGKGIFQLMGRFVEYKRS